MAADRTLFDARSRANQALQQYPSRAWVEILASDVLALADELEETRRALREEMAWDMGGVSENEYKRRARELHEVLAEARECLVEHVVKLPLSKRDHGPVIYRIDAALGNPWEAQTDRQSEAVSDGADLASRESDVGGG